jgi:hypothetical protein
MGETKMESFGKAIPVTGPNTLEPKEPVWFSEVRILTVRLRPTPWLTGSGCAKVGYFAILAA